MEFCHFLKLELSGRYKEVAGCLAHEVTTIQTCRFNCVIRYLMCQHSRDWATVLARVKLVHVDKLLSFHVY